MQVNRRIQSLLSQPVAGIRDVSVVDVALAAFLSAYAVVLTAGIVNTGHPTGGVLAAIGVLTMTAPVAWRRRAPMWASGTIAAGAVFNVVAFGSIVRCGPCLPAAFLIVFEVGVQTKGVRSIAGFGLVAANVIIQSFCDPQLGGGTVILFLTVTAAFYGAGRLVASRAADIATLRVQNEKLREQREQTARVAVLADRTRLATSLDDFLHEQIAKISREAAAGQAYLSSEPDLAREALGAVERDGRAALQYMREVVGSLREEALGEPQPALAQLSELLHRATTADARLTVEGTPRSLPAGIELSGYRIVEHLLGALDDAPDAAVDVRLRFSTDALELQLSGPTSVHADLVATVAAARERASLYGGSVQAETNAGFCTAFARLPLISGGYA